MMKIIAGALAALALTLPAQAEQQKWAAAYVDWIFPDNAPQASTVDQELWIPEASVARYFTLNWDFAGGGSGYMGLQTDADGVGNVRFSLWDATDAKGSACRKFDGEGVGRTCEAGFEIDKSVFYRLRLKRTAADATGQWWAGYVIWTDAAGGKGEIAIGEIKVGKDKTLVDPPSIGNFSEYWGDQVRRCGDIPMSAAVYAPPALNPRNDGSYETVATQPSARSPDDNICRSGREGRGAMTRHVPMKLGSAPGMMIVLGGEKAAADAYAATAQSLKRPPRPAAR